MNKLHLIDYSIVLGYFALVFGVAMFSSRQRKKEKKPQVVNTF